VPELGEMLDQGLERLRFIAQHGVAATGVAGRDGHDPRLDALERLEESPADLAEQHQALDAVTGMEELSQPARLQVVLRAQEQRDVTALSQRRVQPVEDVVEVTALRVDVQARAEHDTDMAHARLARGSLHPHALGLVAETDGVVPDALVGVGTDAFAAAVQDEGNQGLGDAEILGEFGLGNARGPGHHGHFRGTARKLNHGVERAAPGTPNVERSPKLQRYGGIFPIPRYSYPMHENAPALHSPCGGPDGWLALGR